MQFSFVIVCLQNVGRLRGKRQYLVAYRRDLAKECLDNLQEVFEPC